MMKPKLIQIPHSTDGQQISTPSWATYSQKHQHQIQIPKMSRLDELLSRNEQIYQNMRSQLQQISKSNSNIDANINIIKPLYESDYHEADNGQDQNQAENNYQQENMANEHNENNSYFISPLKAQKSTNQITNRVSQIKKQSAVNKNRAYLQANCKIYQETQNNYKNQRTNFYSPLSSVSVHNISAQIAKPLQQKTQKGKGQQKIRFEANKSHSYAETDSSPILSENHQSNHMNLIHYGYPNKHNIQDTTFNQKSKIQDTSELQQSASQQNSRISNLILEIQQKKQRSSRLILETPQNGRMTARLNFKNEQEKLQIPNGISVLFTPFNRLYSSPILQQTGAKQLTLARKSKTQVVLNASINRIVNGIKYKNINIVCDQTALYKSVLSTLKNVQSIYRMRRASRNHNQQYGNTQRVQQKDSVDIGIIGKQNSLKKKLHFALIAHVYADIVEQVNRYFSQSQQQQTSYQSLILGIEHKEQSSGQEPTMINHEAFLGASQVENEIAYGNVNAFISQIFSSMNKTSQSVGLSVKSYSNFIRVTSLTLEAIDKNRTKSVTLCHTKIISTNKVQNEFIAELELNAAIWCINPLRKYYDQTYQVLETYCAYNNIKANKNQNRKDKRQKSLNTTRNGWK